MLPAIHTPLRRALTRALLWLLAGVVAPLASGAQDPDPGLDPVRADVVVMRLEGQLNAGQQALFQRAAARAADWNAVLVIEFDTPGGELERMKQFASAIDKKVKGGLRVIGYVDPDALSAGVWLAIACESLYIAPVGRIGSAQAIQFGPGGVQPAAEKFASAYRAWVRGWAEEHGRNVLLAEAMIDESTEVRRVRIDGVEEIISGKTWSAMVDRGEAPELIELMIAEGEMASLTGSEAVRFGFADGVADDLDGVLAKAGLGGAVVERLAPTRYERALSKLWGMRMLFLFLGLFFLYVELKMPGFGVPGLVSLLCFVVMFTGQYLVGLADVPHIVLAVGGLALVALELFVLPGMLWPGLVGVVCLIGGLLMAQVGPDVSLGSAWDRAILLNAAWQLALTASAALFAIWVLSRFLPQTPVLGRLVLAGGAPTDADALPKPAGAGRGIAVGASGDALTTLRPVGKVRLDGDPAGAEHEARAEAGVIDSGARVRVVEVQATRLIVAEDRPAGGAPDA